ncbi:hypothetical protein GCM10022244_54040 [Streptomyces gulbargensis]|uniref:Uncharacterized protein n=1 Tax=Streptomyces gulbargensis TaxID=364901 RepID=A0ABP7N803_9ACTN
MIRNVVGSILALAGATAAVWSPFRAWYDGRHGRDYRIEDLFAGITDTKAEVIGSVLLPLAFAALLTLVGVVLRSRLLVALAGLVVLGFTVLWMVRVGQAEDGLAVDPDGGGLGTGVALALLGGVLLLLGALLMAGRARSRRAPEEVSTPPGHTTHPGPPVGPPPEERAGYTDTDTPANRGGYGGNEGYDRGAPPYDAPTRSYDVPDPDGRERPPDRDRWNNP